ncbi:hypothetical protein PIB30_051963 [Stylosanthes scabra]|uniref:Uncharacterized protein n=1 Tax=Stylosanthes scabra TaxID=79078 RepID=A0ABU6ZGU6_9FABA|nr:hypothetical protein [Stylosanthes scabra]
MQKQEQDMEEYPFVCPSFSTYSSPQLSHIADQVTRHQYYSPQNDDTDFEFTPFPNADNAVSFDRYNGPVFPVFNQDLAGTPQECGGHGKGGRNSGTEEIRFSMKELLIGEDAENRRRSRDPPSSSSSSSSDDDLDGIPPGTYCVWTPNPVQASPNRCKKSNSTGSSSSSRSPLKRWKILEFLRRSKSDGKKTLDLLTPSPLLPLSGFSSSKKEQKEKKEKKEGTNAKWKEERSGGSLMNESGGVAGKRSAAGVSAHEALYVRNREMRRVVKRRSYLPYKQDLVGFCATLNAMGRTFPPF